MYITGDNEQQFSGTSFSSNSALTATTVPAGTCGGEGGGMYNAGFVSMGSSHFVFNSACNGGAIFNDTTSFGYLAMLQSSVSQNTARVQGGGIYTNQTGNSARIAIDSSGITSNTAADAGGPFDYNNPSSYLESNSTVVLGNNATGGVGTCRNIGDVPCT